MDVEKDESPLLKKVKLIIYLVYCCEAGVFLLFAPWSPHWDTNLFFNVLPSLRDVLLSGWGRGAVSGLGLLHLMLFLADLINYRIILEDI